MLSIPPHTSSIGDESIAFLANSGVVLDDWEQFVLVNSLNKRADGKWAAFEVGLNVARQNGKGEVLLARELVGLYLLEERLIIHSAHQFDTSMEAFGRLLDVIEACPELDKQVKSVSRSHGAEGITLKNRARIRFRTRTKSGGRGFTGDTLILDEAMILPEMFHGALLPTLSARSQIGNPQVWYAGSAVDQLVHEYGVVFARIRERGHSGEDPSLAYFEWSADAEDPNDVDEPLDPEKVAMANPGLGIRISFEHIGHEQRTLSERGFAVERLGVGDWPRTDGLSGVIDLDRWQELLDETSKPLDPVCFAFDMTPDRKRTAISAVGLRSDGLIHVEVIEHRSGTDWVIARLQELQKHRPAAIVCDERSPAGALVRDIEHLGIPITALSTTQYAQACGLFFDAVEESRLRHIGNAELSTAIKGAAQRPLSDAWAWSRKKSQTDITPLVACTIGLWAATNLSAAPFGGGW